MKKRTRQVMLVETLALWLFAGISAEAVQPANRADGSLSVEETIGAVFDTSGGGGFGLRLNILSRANPAAKSAIWGILRNKDTAFHHPRAWCILGYIGDSTDALKMERAARNNFSGSLSAREADSLRAIFGALGRMSARGVEHGSAVVARMSDPRYWKDASFRWKPDSVSTKPPLEYDTVAFLLRECARSGNDDTASRVAAFLSRIDDAELRQRMAGRLQPRVLEALASSVKAAEKVPILAEDRRMLAKLSDRNRAFYSERPTLTEAEQAFIKQAAKEARDAIEELKSGLVKGDHEEVLPSLLDNGRVIDPKKVERLADEFARDLQRQQQVFESLADIKTEPRDYKVSRDASYEFPSMDEEGKPVGVSKKETISVTFRLEGSNEIGNVLFRRQRGSLTIARDGTLIVVMKKIDGKWHWNPFGW